MSQKFPGLAAAMLIAFVPLPAPAQFERPAATTQISGSSISWRPKAAHRGGELTIVGKGYEIRRDFRRGDDLAFTAVDASGAPLPDGSYNWELTLAPLRPSRAGSLDNGRPGDSDRQAETRDGYRYTVVAPGLSVGARASGAFQVRDGQIISAESGGAERDR